MTFYDYKVNSTKRTWKFNKIVSDNVMNIEYIHPLKQKIIVDIVKSAKENIGIKSIRVFGSAITSECDFESDLDLCIDWNFDCYDDEGVLVPETVSFMHNISMITKGKCDVVHLQYLAGTIVEQDAREGVVVYVYDGQ
ncbi:MAG: hypothetical protein IJD40_03925 [Lachnospiraceae bacterium]|nr:hypothetical protein [Lachnospiraceae bacterium]